MSRYSARRVLAFASIAAIPLAYAFLHTSPTAAIGADSTQGANSRAVPVAGQAAISSMRTAEADPIQALALTPAQAGADPFFVEPRVPRAAGTPCVDVLGENVIFTEQESSVQFTWTPTCDDTGPWSKIVLVVETTGPRDPSAYVMRLHFNNTGEGPQDAEPQPGGGVLYMGGPHQHELTGIWRLERDVTEYADALHRGFRIGYGTAPRDNAYQDFDDGLLVTARSIKLIHYPATTSTPAQRTADEMRSLDSSNFVVAGAGWTFDDLPRNIERVYLDVMARPLEARVWYSCVPEALRTEFPQLDSRFGMGDYRPFLAGPELGCGAENGSYKEVEVFIDDQLAGLAPVFPSIPSRINFTDVIDYPAPAVQALNIMPFRVDLTPFAAVLNDGQPHSIVARMTNSATSSAIVTGQLLLYLDEARSVVTGAVTRNTLASQPGVAAITDTVALAGSTVQGNISTFLRREFNIDGYVDTSRGRIRSSVYQVSRFQNTQTVRVTGPATFPRNVIYEQDYLQQVRLSSTVDRVMRRTLGTTLLSEDKDYTTYPLTIDYASGGEVRWFESLPGPIADHFDLDVHQARGIRASHFRRGQTRYTTRLSDVFDASHHWLGATQTDPGGDFDWYSTRRYLFTDNRASCYSAGLTTANGELQTRTRGTECPNGTSALRWYTHPDGAPEAMLWTAHP